MYSRTDPFYPDSYVKADKVQGYIDDLLEDINFVLIKAEHNLDDKDYDDFIEQLKDMIG